MENRFKDLKPGHLYIAGVIISFFAIIISALRIGEIYSTLSEFGADYRTAFLFNFLMFVSGIILIIGCIQLCRVNFKKYGIFRTIALLISTSSLAFIGLFPLGISQNIRGIHHIFTFLFFFGMPICMILFGTLFYKSNQTIFLILTTLGVLDFIQIVIFYNSRQPMLWQWIGIIIILIFNFILLVYSSSLSKINNEFEELE
ncbi:MAG: DUF998 domain-containing protein [Candidatus Dojkabacteria bacterium]